MRKIEQRIIHAIDKRQSVTLSQRDQVRTIDNVIIVTLWNTDIVKIYFNEDGLFEKMVLSNGGYQTVTTKSRINAILRHFNFDQIYQKNFEWVWPSNFIKDSTGYRDIYVYPV